MINIIIYTFLLSISPFGESRVGIPYGVLNGLHPLTALGVGLIANLLVFPLMMFLIDTFNGKLWQYRVYKSQSVKLMRRAKSGVGDKIQKYGFWGLMMFVMIPLPFTGVYMGTIAAYIFKLPRVSSFVAISIGAVISCLILAFGSHLGSLVPSLF
ncbi:COG2426 family protein [Echinicola vietnamensis]|uniref:Putative membrane protein n=1 Tax=Echinicola vietnamensis (strain DSM 17526 / LMG 23754 / KMM 6221) TaxID=926556 RepID=L0G3E4_ECHVK|nr:small multi-drug export protein [Echinicola vietnamensis]AGA80764.1 putative membrane protein [Echinicola vietnamensis DSM 17526]